MKQESFLGYLDRTEYNVVMKNIIKRRALLEVKFLKDNVVFSHVPPRKLTLLQLNSTTLKLHRNQVVYQEDKLLDKING